MANNKSGPRASEQPVETKYSRQELIANAKAIFSVMPEVVAGALHGNDAQELTLTEVKEAIKSFLERKVK